VSVDVNDMRCRFANLKYEQLLTEKYFIETCFSKKHKSYSPKDKLKDLALKIKCNEETKQLCS
jgi:hypothetical protein